MFDTGKDKLIVDQLSFASKKSLIVVEPLGSSIDAGFGIDFWHTVEFSRIVRAPPAIPWDRFWGNSPMLPPTASGLNPRGEIGAVIPLTR